MYAYENINCDLCGSCKLELWDKTFRNSYSRCINCGLIFTNPRISNVSKKEKVLYSEKYFSDKPELIDKLNNARQKTYQMEIKGLNKYTQKGKIFDVGCGTGRFLNFLGDEWEKFGCDISSYALDIASKKNIQTFYGEFENLDIEKGQFDVIYFRASLHHTYSPLKCLQKAYDLLKLNGVIAVSQTLNIDGLCGSLFRGHMRGIGSGTNYLFTRSTLTKYFQKSKFNVLHYYYPYFGTGYDSFSDWIDIFVKYFLYSFFKVNNRLSQEQHNDFRSPPFYKNFITIYAQKYKHT